MGPLNLKDEALIADARTLAGLLGASTTDAVRRAVQEKLARERGGRDAEKRRKSAAVLAAAADFRGVGGEVLANAELGGMPYDPETGLPR
ncbi:hypothetical protein GCM10011504_15160 [Siccirubricoccus deserti]|uniref:Type II toxin-antitoxin system VapB family antitoxin n=1 Tax=Siccirubricoccus deserti TaxID=2013562 RepID=A0A9X0UCH8_9PROT|nr:type II toxin-antitoxin system VapB family antitoxin [Siccirubricoccus deserti]MBC4015252.1 type II toxin-antitoxin system VapB family antitoxin [Siccirubricoccus deserti]GGC37770.1 hypothetical protein GCM10011504_15160 [Siccirubricoccus deserti]